ncbi:hypothetical protein AGLY_001963, partial [Aphis glycines]
KFILIDQCSTSFIIVVSKTYEKSCIKFSTHSHLKQNEKFYKFSTSKLLTNFRNFDIIYRTNLNLKRFKKKLTIYKKPRIKFSSFVPKKYPNFLFTFQKKIIRKIKNFIAKKSQNILLCINNTNTSFEVIGTFKKNRFRRKLLFFQFFFENCWKLLTFDLYNNALRNTFCQFTNLSPETTSEETTVCLFVLLKPQNNH